MVQLDWILATSFGANWITMGISSATLVSFSAILRKLDLQNNLIKKQQNQNFQCLWYL